MDRRSVLAALALAGSGGCLGGEPWLGDDGPAPSPGSAGTPPPGTVAMGTTRGGVTVSAPRVARSVATPWVGRSTHVDVAAPADAQFLVVEATMTDGWGGVDPMVELSLFLDGERGARPVTVAAYGPDGDRVTLAFEAPIGEYATAVVARDGARWHVPGAVRVTLAVAPRFEIRTFATPSAVEPGQSVPAVFTVANVGDRAGRFLAEFGATIASDVGEVSLDVPAGGERTHEELLSPDYSAGTESIRVGLDWGRDRLVREVAISDE